MEDMKKTAKGQKTEMPENPRNIQETETKQEAPKAGTLQDYAEAIGGAIAAGAVIVGGIAGTLILKTLFRKK